MEASTVLLERCTAGFTVRLSYWPSGALAAGGMVILSGSTDQADRSCSIPPALALDAFEHPCCYLPDPAPFFARVIEVEQTGDEYEALASMRAPRPDEEDMA